jgi:hypothetical protein
MKVPLELNAKELANEITVQIEITNLKQMQIRMKIAKYLFVLASKIALFNIEFKENK